MSNPVDDMLNLDILKEAEDSFGEETDASIGAAIMLGQIRSNALAAAGDTNRNVKYLDALVVIEANGFELMFEMPIGNKGGDVYRVYIHPEQNYVVKVESYCWGEPIEESGVNSIKCKGYRLLDWPAFSSTFAPGYASACYNWRDNRQSDGWNKPGWGDALFDFTSSMLEGFKRKCELIATTGSVPDAWPSPSKRGWFDYRIILHFEDHKVGGELDWDDKMAVRKKQVLERMKLIPDKYRDQLNIRHYLEE
jgi:hypothetical protein